MITTKNLYKREQFEKLKKWDFVACEFHRDTGPDRIRFWVFEVYENKEYYKEIILDREKNIYFNYDMYLNNDPARNLKEIFIIQSKEIQPSYSDDLNRYNPL